MSDFEIIRSNPSSSVYGNSETTPLHSVNPTPHGSPSPLPPNRDIPMDSAQDEVQPSQDLSQQQRDEFLRTLPAPPTEIPSNLPKSILKLIDDAAERKANTESVIDSLTERRNKFHNNMVNDEIPDFVELAFPHREQARLDDTLEEFNSRLLRARMNELHVKIVRKIEEKDNIVNELYNQAILESNRIFKMNTRQPTRPVNPFTFIYNNDCTLLMIIFQIYYNKYVERNIQSQIAKEKATAAKAAKFEEAKAEKARLEQKALRDRYKLKEDFTQEDQILAMEKQLSILMGKGSGPSKSRKGPQSSKGKEKTRGHVQKRGGKSGRGRKQNSNTNNNNQPKPNPKRGRGQTRGGRSNKKRKRNSQEEE